MRVSLSYDGITIIEPIVELTPNDPRDGIRLLTEMIEKQLADRQCESLCGCVPGVMENDILVSSPHLPNWKGLNIKEELSKHFGCDPIIIVHDASLACLGEAVYGAGKGYKAVAYMTVSTGIGGGYVVDRKIEKHKFNTEIGHQIIDMENNLTLEGIASGTAIKEKYGCILSELTGEERKEAIQKISHALAVGIHNTIDHWSPDIIILGGSVILNSNDLFEGVIEELGNIADVYPAMPKIVRASLGDSSALYGALCI